MSDTPPARPSGRPSSVRARRSAIDHIADHDTREIPGLLEESSVDTASLPMSTFSIVPQTTSARIDEDLAEDDDVVAAEVSPEDAPSAALDEVRAPVTDPARETPVVVATVDPVSAPRTVQKPRAQKAPAEKAPTQKAPAQKAPAQKAPAQKAPAQKSTAQKAPTQKRPAQQPPVQQPPAQKAPREDVPGEEASTPEPRAEKVPGQTAPAPKAPARETASPARKAPARNGAAGNGPAPRKATGGPRPLDTGSGSATTSAGSPERTIEPAASGVAADTASTPEPSREPSGPRLTLASPALVVDIPPAEQQEVPDDERAVAIEDAPVTPEELEPRTSSVAVVAEPDGPTDRDEAIEEPPSTATFTGMSVARALAGAPESSAMLTAERLLDDRRDTRRVPEGFWQKLLYDVSGRRIRLADSRAARERIALTARIAKPMTGSARFVPVLTRKGGVGKTTITTLLGMALADARDDRVIAIDANPDRGTLAERIARRSDHTVRDLVRDAGSVTGYTEFSRLVSRDETRLDVLASDADPHLSQAFDEHDYDVVARLASQYYSIVLTDCGTGIVHSVMGATLRHADSIVIVSGTSVDEARSAAETVSWLEANGYPELASSAVVVINSTAPGTPAVRLDEIEKHFESRVRSIVRIPFDPQLATGAAISFADLRPETRRAARELSALVVEGLPARRAVREPADG